MPFQLLFWTFHIPSVWTGQLDTSIEGLEKMTTNNDTHDPIIPTDSPLDWPERDIRNVYRILIEIYHTSCSRRSSTILGSKTHPSSSSSTRRTCSRRRYLVPLSETFFPRTTVHPMTCSMLLASCRNSIRTVTWKPLQSTTSGHCSCT